MFACTVAHTQDRNGRVLRSELCTVNVRTAHNDRVSVARVGLGCVLQHLSFLDAVPLRSDRHDVSAAVLHGRFERGARARRRLIEEHAENLATENVNHPRTLSLKMHLMREREQIERMCQCRRWKAG
jgi:hypothetical protein